MSEIFKLKSTTKAPSDSLKHGSKERFVFIELINPTKSFTTGIVAYKRKVYFSVEKVVQQEYIDEETGDTIPEVTQEIDTIIASDSEPDRVRYYEKQDVDAVHNAIKNNIPDSLSYSQSDVVLLKQALLYEINNDTDLKEKLKVTAFELV